jgi:hypothetical protein
MGADTMIRSTVSIVSVFKLSCLIPYFLEGYYGLIREFNVITGYIPWVYANEVDINLLVTFKSIDLYDSLMLLWRYVVVNPGWLSLFSGRVLLGYVMKKAALSTSINLVHLAYIRTDLYFFFRGEGLVRRYMKIRCANSCIEP